MKNFIFIVVVFGAGCSVLFDYNEAPTENYSTYSEIVRRKGFDSGWLPLEIPGSARGITETHNIDTGEIWLQFHLDSSEADGFLEKCTPRKSIDFPSRRRTRRVAPWWPEEMMGAVVSAQTKNWHTYFCKNMRHSSLTLDSFVALDREAGKILYWRAPK